MCIFQPAINVEKANLRVYLEREPDKKFIKDDNVASPGVVKYTV